MPETQISLSLGAYFTIFGGLFTLVSLMFIPKRMVGIIPVEIKTPIDPLIKTSLAVSIAAFLGGLGWLIYTFSVIG